MNWVAFSSAVTSGPKHDSKHFCAAINLGFTFVMTSTLLYDGQEGSVHPSPVVPGGGGGNRCDLRWDVLRVS
jgi:hypothetical protein